MNLRSSRKIETDINITPLIDVVFLLLIFFMVSTTFERESEIKITLPDASGESMEARPEAIMVRIDTGGVIYIDDQPLINAELSTVRAALSERIRGRDEMPVVIRADADVSHQAVIRVMDAARQSGLVNITFATRVREEETE